MKLNDELSLAMEAARRAGNLIVKKWSSRKIVSFKSKMKIDFATNLDMLSEKMITSMIRKHFPNHGILAEEGTSFSGEKLWVIDPLDGTVNFTHGYPFFCVSIAFVVGGKQVIGIVYDPLKNEMFHAVAGKGAYLNGKKIKVSRASRLSDALIATGFYYERGDVMKITLEKMGELLSLGIHGIRRDGSAALDMCYVACGRFDGYWEYVLNPWDFAASSLIAKEAGAIVTTPQGGKIEMKKNGIIAANPILYRKMFEILKL